MRIAGRSDCGQCFEPFKPFQTVYYLPIDHNSFCNVCRDKIESRFPGSDWVPSLFVGTGEDGAENIKELIKVWNETMNGPQLHCETY